MAVLGEWQELQRCCRTRSDAEPGLPTGTIRAGNVPVLLNGREFRKLATISCFWASLSLASEWAMA
jgi:hypothetical protein